MGFFFFICILSVRSTGHSTNQPTSQQKKVRHFVYTKKYTNFLSPFVNIRLSNKIIVRWCWLSQHKIDIIIIIRSRCHSPLSFRHFSIDRYFTVCWYTNELRRISYAQFRICISSFMRTCIQSWFIVWINCG